jgi:glycosyltransferase involved in cell wall biosynthesis
MKTKERASTGNTRKNSIRICYVNPTVLIKRPVSELSARMADAGFLTSILIPKKLFKKKDLSLHHSRLMEKSKVLTYSTLNLPIKSEQPLPITFAFCRNTFRALGENDIIHMWVPYYLTNLKIILAKKLFYPKKKLILTMDTVPGYSFSMGRFMDRMFTLYCKIFQKIIFNTPDIITLYGKSLVPYAIKAGVPKEKIRVISTGVDTKKYAAVKAGNAGKTGSNNSDNENNHSKNLRKELGLKSSKTKIALYAGLIVPRKGIDKIISIADRLRNEDIVFVLAGEGPKRKQYEAKAEKSGLGKKVFFLGQRKDVPELYAQSDLFVLASDGEGLPGVVMEAMAAGVPCVASDIPCIPDLIEDGKSGFLCPKDDIDCFAKKIKELLRSPAKRALISRNAMQKMKSVDWDRIITHYDNLYEELINKSDEKKQPEKK